MRKLHFNLQISALLLAFFAIVPTVHPQSADWETLRPDGEEFAISMPKGSTLETSKEPYHKMDINTRVYLSQTTNGPVFAVVSLSGIKSNPALYTEQQRFNSYVDAFKTLFPPKLKGKTIPVKLTLVGDKTAYGHPGREYRLTVGDTSGTVQTFATRKRFYAIAYLNAKKDDAIQEQFLSSFVLPQRVEPPPAPEAPNPLALVTKAQQAAAGNTGATEANTEVAKQPAESEGEPKKGRSISGGVLNGKAISLQKPEYPAEAKAAGASGSVSVQVTVDEGGNVVEAKAVSGHPLLQPVSVTAAFQAKFAPTSLMGEPVKVTGVIIFNFPKQAQ